MTYKDLHLDIKVSKNVLRTDADILITTSKSVFAPGMTAVKTVKLCSIKTPWVSRWAQKYTNIAVILGLFYDSEQQWMMWAD